MFHPLIGMPEGWEWLIILVIVVFVFGAAKLPDLARGSGQALRIFRSEARGLKEDEEKAKALSATDEVALQRKAELDARQAELDAERAKLNGDA